MAQGRRVLVRQMGEAKLNALGAMALQTKSNWWQDLLRSWAPSGSPLQGPRQLRLAIRDGYLNFYHQGQSIARVSLEKGATPRLEVHHKYVFGDAIGQRYMRLSDNVVRYSSGTDREAGYEGLTTISTWIDRAKVYSGKEKCGLEHVVAANADVIDLEMGVPWWPEQSIDAETPERTGKYAPRMDMIALERNSDGQISLVFWEAKTLGDQRLRSRADPEVFKQLGLYHRYLSRLVYRDAVSVAYAETCKLLTTFHRMAAELSGESLYPPLGSLVSRIASEAERLSVDPKPRLLIFPGKLKSGAFERETATWSDHLAILSKEFSVYCVDDPKDAVLSG
jgi:hypothetical protein